MTSEPETSNSGYSTRNKRRKLNEMESSPLTIPRPISSFESIQISRRMGEVVNTPMHSRSLDKALKSILSENPRMRNNNRGEINVGENINVVELTPSADDEASSSAAVVAQETGRMTASSISMSSQSRETTPSSSLDGQIVDIAPFTEYFQKEREGGKVSKEIRDEAIKILREWRSEWYVEDKRIRELKRKIKSYTAVHVDVPPPTLTESKSRGRTVSRPPVSGIVKAAAETPKESTTSDAESAKPSVTSPSDAGRRDSITGPNGLTGSYWDISISEMGRGSRRRTKTLV
jgi:hypothetical protein